MKHGWTVLCLSTIISQTCQGVCAFEQWWESGVYPQIFKYHTSHPTKEFLQWNSYVLLQCKQIKYVLLKCKKHNKQSPKSLQPHDLRFHSSQLPIWLVVSNICIYIWKHKKCSKPPTQLWHNGSSRSCQRALEDQAQSDMHNLTGEPFRKKISETRVIYELYMGYIWVIYIYIPQP